MEAARLPLSTDCDGGFLLRPGLSAGGLAEGAAKVLIGGGRVRVSLV